MRSQLSGFIVGALMSAAIFGAVAACQQQPPTQEIVLKSPDGKREVRLTADGLVLEDAGGKTELTFGRLELNDGATSGRFRVEDGAASIYLKDQGPNRNDRPFINLHFDTNRNTQNSTGKPVTGIALAAGGGMGPRTIIHESADGGYLAIQNGFLKITQGDQQKIIDATPLNARAEAQGE